MLDIVADLVKSLGIISECIPSPLSFTVTISSSFISFTSKLTLIVPSLVNFIALVMRFAIPDIALFYPSLLTQFLMLVFNSNSSLDQCHLIRWKFISFG